MKNVLLRHLRSCQAAAACALVTVSAVGLPLLAAGEYPLADSTYAEYLAIKFKKTGAEHGSFDNSTIEQSAFDFAQYYSHTCYRPTEYDVPQCKQEFGPYYNLRTTMDSGQLWSILSRYSYFRGVDKFLPGTVIVQPGVAPAAQGGSSEPVAAPVQERTQTRTERSQELWSICKQYFPEQSEAIKCNQRNIRLIDNLHVPVEGNVY